MGPAINLQELIRRLAENLANGIIDAEAVQMCEANGNSRNGYRPRTLKTCVGELFIDFLDDCMQVLLGETKTSESCTW